MRKGKIRQRMATTGRAMTGQAMTGPQRRESRIQGSDGGLKLSPPVYFVGCSAQGITVRPIIFRMVILRKRIVGVSKPMLERFVLRARRAVSLRAPVDVLITSSAELRVLNRRFRGMDKATDVLSFPSAKQAEQPMDRPTGEIAISADVARENAKQLGHSVADEVKILTLHGILH